MTARAKMPPGAPRVPEPEVIAKTLCWLVRDRGTMTLDNLHGVSRLELEAMVKLRKWRPSKSYGSFEESLAAAIQFGWIASYRNAGNLRFYPNYARRADPEPAP